MEVVFSHMPATLEEFTSMPEFHFATPFQVAALFVIAICNYPRSDELCYDMLDAIKGPQKLSIRDKSFIRERMSDKKDYLGKAYLKGAAPGNNYEPTQPYTVIVGENPYTYVNEGYAVLYIKTTGADSPRPITLRKKGNEWFLWEFPGPLSGIRIPVSQDAWA